MVNSPLINLNKAVFIGGGPARIPMIFCFMAQALCVFLGIQPELLITANGAGIAQRQNANLADPVKFCKHILPIQAGPLRSLQMEL